jgi:hypothetical protein
MHRFETFKLLRWGILQLRDIIAKPDPKPDKPPDPKEFQEHILKIVKVAQENNISVVLLNTDLIISYQVDFLRNLAKEKGFPFVDFTRLLRGTLQKLLAGEGNYPELKFYRTIWGEEMLKKYPHLYLMWEGIHPNALGHWLMAQALAQAVQQDLYFKGYLADRFNTKHFDILPKPKDLTPP